MLITSWKCGAPPSKHRETTGKTVGRPLAKLLEDHWQNCRKTTGKTAGRPLAKRLEDHWQNGWKTVGKIAGKPLVKSLESRRETTGKNCRKTAGKRPVFGSLLPVSISDWNGREGPLRRHFSAFGGGCHKGPAFQA